jgi:signal transduction histidine kinase/uncharacterized membrane protein affecting hemolysin expression
VNWFRDAPLKRKLTALITLVSGFALLLGCGGFAIYEQRVFRREMALELSIIANMFDDDVAPGLVFNDTASIAETLATLGAHPHIVAACVYDHSGKIVASYLRPEWKDRFHFPARARTSQFFAADHLDTFQDVTLKGQFIGVVYIGSDLNALRAHVWHYATIVSALLVICSLVALVLASRLQRIISQPIEDLAQTVATVATKKNYGVRAHKQGNDELGRLIDGFNDMLAQIQARDTALLSANDNLERRVEERTAKLADASGRLEAMLANSPDVIYFKDTQSRFTLVSRSKVQATVGRVSDLRARRTARGLPADVPEAELLTGLTDFDTFNDDDARVAYEDEQKIVRTGEAVIGKLERQTFLDGTVRWSLTSKMPWLNAGGKIIGTFGISKDISDLKETEQKLEATHRQLLQTSRQAGMAEVATGVLHNVGNVLNSVNVSATLVIDHVRHTKAGNIAKVAAMFAQHKTDLVTFLTTDPRGQMIPGYLDTLAESLAAEHKVLLDELDHLRKNIDHIKDIVAMQQAYARTSGVTETVSVPDMIEDALRTNAGSLARHAIGMIQDYQARPVITTDKHKVMQILINLVGNAKHACEESGRADKQITVRTTSDERSVKIAVMDNGVGIPAENLTRIFNHGFTTKKTGHGFGLHSAALAAKELGGSLHVQSEGTGHGAMFTLELPYKPDTPVDEKSVG